MKILHIADNFIEGWGYQENLLPLYQKRAGHNVVVVADNDHLKYIQNPKLADTIKRKGVEYYYDGIKVYKIKTYLSTSSTSFFCKGLYGILNKEKPDIIFHHNLNTSTLSVASKYKKTHPRVLIYADNHADWINESKNRFWHLFFYDILIPLQVKRLGNLVNYYIGVSPMRCQYLYKVFHIPQEKIRFLPIGCDTDQANIISESRDSLRTKYGIPKDAFTIVSGGKIARSKGTIELIEACIELREKSINISLVLFGKIDEEVGQIANKYRWITCLGWCDRITTLALLKLADVGCWPWLHTTLIEDTIAAGTPIVVKDSDNVCHFSREKAGYFLKCGDKNELINALADVRSNLDVYRKNTYSAREKFSYSALVKRLENEEFYEL